MARRYARRRRAPAEPVTMEIESLSHEGRGIARPGGKVTFVDGALAGETIVGQVVGGRSQFDEAVVKEILEKSVDRVDPPCQFAHICGGCSLQHMNSEAQLLFKQDVLLEKMQHATGLSQDEYEVLPHISSSTTHYRRKARLAVRDVKKKGAVLVGFREKQGTFITVMDTCWVLHQSAAKLIKPLQTLLLAMDCRQQVPQIEVAVGETQPNGSAGDELNARVALIFRHLVTLTEADTEKLHELSRQWQLDI